MHKKRYLDDEASQLIEERLTVTSPVRSRQGNESTMAAGEEFDPVSAMIQSRKFLVLERAITALEKAQLSELRAITHEMGGAIGFYTFVDEARELSLMSRWLESNPEAAEDEMENRRSKVLDLLREKRENHGK